MTRANEKDKQKKMTNRIVFDTGSLTRVLFFSSSAEMKE